MTKVTKIFRIGLGEPVTALTGVTMHIPASQALAITGPSGSGKSTLLHLIGGMDRPDSGTIKVGDLDITSLSESARARYRRQVGFVFQRFHLLPALTAVDNVLIPVLPFKVDFNKQSRARELLDAVGLADRYDHLPSQLSGGEQQRVAIARALIGSPRLLLADEPTGNLDSRSGTAVIGLLLGLRRKYGLTMLVATHDATITQRCHRVVQLSDGQVVRDVENRDSPEDGR